MNQQALKEKPGFRWFTNLAGAYLIFMFLVLCAGFLVLKTFQGVPNISTTPVPTITPTPHILVHQPINKNIVTHEDFSSNKREWGLYYPYGKLEVINGKLILQSNLQRGYVIGKTRWFDFSEKTYYIQADFTTDVNEAYTYGLVFGLNESLGTYYMFDISPKAGFFRLLKYNAGKWEELIPFSQSIMNPYPMFNTLSVYFSEGDIELYINGNLISGFTDSDFFRSTGVGVFVNDTGYRLIVDNFFVYAEK